MDKTSVKFWSKNRIGDFAAWGVLVIAIILIFLIRQYFTGDGYRFILYFIPVDIVGFPIFGLCGWLDDIKAQKIKEEQYKIRRKQWEKLKNKKIYNEVVEIDDIDVEVDE